MSDNIKDLKKLRDVLTTMHALDIMSDELPKALDSRIFSLQLLDLTKEYSQSIHHTNVVFKDLFKV
jgi:hypothetical protein